MNRNQLQENLLPQAHHKETKYLRWYLDIIENTNLQNRKKLKKINEYYIYYENHHILPKAKGLFDEYEDLDEYPWNGVLLTAKEHFICHRLIQKHYAKIEYTLGDIKMSWAIDNMSSNGKYNAKHYENYKLNLSHTEETKKKMSISAKNRPPITEETRRKMGLASKGRKHTEETKENMRLTRQNVSEEVRNKISISKKGKKHSEEHKHKIGLSCKGKKHSEASKKKMSESHRGHIVTENTKEKISASLKGNVPWNKGIKQKTVKCPHCGKEGGILNMKRWHFDNCKEIK